MRLIVWGTYDTGKPRVRLLLRGLREVGVEITEIQSDVWHGVEDKGTLTGVGNVLTHGLRLLAAYPRLIWRLMRAPKADAILVCYPGHLDVLLLWPFAKLRRMPVVWDVFLSAYNTVVEDRGKLRAGSIGARLIAACERLAVWAVDRAFMDTRAHADYLADQTGVSRDRIGQVLVGVEPEAFPPAPAHVDGDDAAVIDVLFYGQFIPLHGIETIVRAARLDDGQRVRWTVIGRGQKEEDIRAMLDETPLNSLTWIPWVEYQALIQRIHSADICLGVFGTSEKAGRVIPNKVFQILSAGKPLVTRECADLVDLIGQDLAVGFVSPGDPRALLDAILEMSERMRLLEGPHHAAVWPLISPQAVGQEVLSEIEAALV